ncbi:MAG: hypothetical protein GY739_19435, partial [Mesoflavibacter sp.]|nr:hypothetical protein [Mesoflavibacter sp.]
MEPGLVAPRYTHYGEPQICDDQSLPFEYMVPNIDAQRAALTARQRRTAAHQYFDPPEFLPNLNLGEKGPTNRGETLMETIDNAPQGVTQEQQHHSDDELFCSLNRILKGEELKEYYHSYDESRIVDYNRISWEIGHNRVH